MLGPGFRGHMGNRYREWIIGNGRARKGENSIYWSIKFNWEQPTHQCRLEKQVLGSGDGEDTSFRKP